MLHEGKRIYFNEEDDSCSIVSEDLTRIDGVVIKRGEWSSGKKAIVHFPDKPFLCPAKVIMS